MAVTDSQGSIVTFDTITFKSIKASFTAGGGSTSGGGDSQIDISHIGLASGSNKEYQAPPLAEVASAGGAGVIAQITVDFLDLEKPETNVVKDIDLGAKLAIKGTANCTEYTLDASVNDVIRGSAKFDLITLSPTYT